MSMKDSYAHMGESMESLSASSLNILLQCDIYSVSFLATMLFNYYTYYSVVFIDED
jgi:hypothetical protein